MVEGGLLSISWEFRENRVKIEKKNWEKNHEESRKKHKNNAKIYDKVMSVFSFFLGWERFFPTWRNLNFPNLLITNLLINLRPLVSGESKDCFDHFKLILFGF